jgi:hypothetical protein
MNPDPAGLYARLAVDPSAPPEAIVAAFRRMARVLHPDVAGTGNAEAFVRVKEAYDILGDAGRRSAYDRAARAAAAVAVQPPVRAAAEPATRGPRWSDLPIVLWVLLGGVGSVAAMMAVLQFTRAPAPPAPPVARPFAPSAPPGPPPARVTLPVIVPAAELATYYVIPGSGPTVLWRRDIARDAFLPMGVVAVFSPVQALSVVPEHGLVEIRLADGGSGYVYAARLVPGNRMAAHQAYCAYNAGLAPQNGEILERRGGGAAQLKITNRAGQPAVVKLRDASGRSAASVFVAPGASTTVENLPDGSYRPEYALGELWSRACHEFAAGMRAQRLAEPARLSALSPLVIPPDLSVGPAPMDIPDSAFEHE